MARRQHWIGVPGMMLLAALLLPAAARAAGPAEKVWKDVPEGEARGTGERRIRPGRYRTVAVDRSDLEHALSRARPEGVRWMPGDEELVLLLPLPDGQAGRFRIEESPIMEPELAARFPEIRTYRGQGLDDPSATARLDLTPAGFHALILSASGTVYIDPYRRGNTVHHISYRKRDLANPHRDGLKCAFDEALHSLVPGGTEAASSTEALPSGATLRTYRTAVAATGEYTGFHGGTVEDGLAAIVTAMNRVNGIYEREVAIRMVLVADNDQIVYTRANQDPYTNNNGIAMLDQNQQNLDQVIGGTNYDIGHVFSTGGGGVAALGVACRFGNKAKGVTGLASPTGDPFYVDYVSHELGHQWGALHSFNGDESSCSNRSASTAYEPGSGSTIMAYAGLCGSQNLQSNSDDYFHATSYQEIVGYSQSGFGDSCAAASATGNSAPVVEAGITYTVPVETPFVLCGSATDPDGDPMTYSWEEFDLGPAGHPDSPVNGAPIFRSFPAVTDPCRTFPRLPDLLAGTHTIGELLPTYGRTMNFRFTARDNRAGGGGVDFDAVWLTVSDSAGPFRLTSPNTAVSWTGGDLETVTWDVAGTDLSPVWCTEVDLLFSADGGLTLPYTLLAGTPNDGTQTITVPNLTTVQARIQARCAGNVFFDLSDENFSILASLFVKGGSVDLLQVEHAASDVLLSFTPSCQANDTDYEIYEGTFDDFTTYLPRTCSTGGSTSFTLTPAAESSFYLVVPSKVVQEGSYGTDGDGAERPPSAAACLPQLAVGCP